MSEFIADSFNQEPIDMRLVMAERRFAWFNVSNTMLQDNPGAVVAALDGILITRAEYKYATATLEYEGFSTRFDPVPQGESPPGYSLLFSYNHETMSIDFVWRKNV